MLRWFYVAVHLLVEADVARRDAPCGQAVAKTRTTRPRKGSPWIAGPTHPPTKRDETGQAEWSERYLIRPRFMFCCSPELADVVNRQDILERVEPEGAAI